MLQPRVTIVIVNWKTPKLLEGCLDSILQDPRANEFEIYVVDNASGDGSVEMLREKYPVVNTIANDQNLGFSKGCNQVIRQAKGRFIFLLNPDTVVLDNAVTRLANYLDRHPDCGAVGPKVLNSDRTLQLACRRAFPTPEAAFFRMTYLSRLFPNHPRISRYNLTAADPNKELDVDVLSGAAMMVRHEVVKQIGLLDEDIFMFSEDIDWCWRIKQANWRVVYTPDAEVIHMHGASSRLRPIGATINFHKGMEVFYKKHLAQKYWAPFNFLVYAAIWTRAAMFILVNVARATLAAGRYSS